MRRLKRLDEGVRLRLEDEDDLWTAAQLCSAGARVGMLSHRRDSTTGTQAESMCAAIQLTLFQERDNETKLDRLDHPHTFSWYGLGARRATEG